VTVDEDSSLWPYSEQCDDVRGADARDQRGGRWRSGGDASTSRGAKPRRLERNRTRTGRRQRYGGRGCRRDGNGLGSADGSTRYAYVAMGHDPTGGTWLDESYQLHDGEYLGSRHHIRAYASPDSDDQWTAMQTHREHWDWFRLSHTVTSAEDSQRYVEREFMDRRYVSSVSRDHLGNDRGFDSDGWVTIIDLNGDDGDDGDDRDDGGPPVHLAMLGPSGSDAHWPCNVADRTSSAGFSARSTRVRAGRCADRALPLCPVRCDRRRGTAR